MNRVSDDIERIYKEITPALRAVAAKYKVSNIPTAVSNWMSTAWIIAHRFDEGELVKRVQVGSEYVEYDPEAHDPDLFVKSLKRYLVTSFTNDVFKHYNVNKKFVNTPNEEMGDSSIIDIAIFNKNKSYQSGHAGADGANISDLKGIIGVDIAKIKADCATILDLTNIKFLEATIGYCDTLIEKFGDFEVVQDLSAEKNRGFFSEDFREDAEIGIRKELCKIVLEEDNPALLQKLSILINPEQRGTLQKRIFRYFFENKGGMPARLKRKCGN